MKVKELISELSKLDQNIEVLCSSSDDELLAPQHLFRILNIEYVDTVQAELVRGEDNIPSMKIEKNGNSQDIAVIEVTSIF